MTFQEMVERALSLPERSCAGMRDGWDEWRGDGEEEYKIRFDGEGRPLSIQQVGTMDVFWALDRSSER